MKKYKLLIMLLLVVIVTGSCKKYLDLKSNAKLVTPHTLADIQGILDDGELLNLKTTPSMNESSADDFFLLPATFNSLPVSFQAIYRWQPNDTRFPNDWSLGYQAVFNANLSLDLLENVERNSANNMQWDNIKGSALFYRAFHTLNLTMQYAKVYNEATADADLGIVLRLSSDFNVPSVRSSVRNCYQKVISDLRAALELLPVYPVHLMRPSKGAVNALLARTYLFMGKYQEAKFYSDEALKINSTLMDYNGDAFIGALTAAIPFKKLNPETIFYAEMGQIQVLHTATRGRIDTTLYADYANADLRKTGFFNLVSGYPQYKGSYTGATSVFFTGLATDELFLIRAECNAYLGELTAALSDVNTLLKNRWNRSVVFVPVLGTNREDVLSKIRLERRKELLMRGLRWIDLKRYNREGANIVISRKINNQLITLPPNSSYFALPIPSDIIEESGIAQN
ncbi:hypothetical protein ASE74_10030 [Pedobacter sp. Leaf216]|uniref:RagB/SusD family nutrient uptake outer membrane protein n=1 Tax=Pedobacter sp. Leaf216 TaxID=1735684 RepID=UPI0006F7DB55|nr:RagB/SusD family nutrient uptake outer membrane protein [Pedobacter sp. Leaf216]KQM65200.1 hypothetical protein ASE74_10030 [Pedobacter sp. Leaf216]